MKGFLKVCTGIYKVHNTTRLLKVIFIYITFSLMADLITSLSSSCFRYFILLSLSACFIDSCLKIHKLNIFIYLCQVASKSRLVHRRGGTDSIFSVIFSVICTTFVWSLNPFLFVTIPLKSLKNLKSFFAPLSQFSQGFK